MLVQLVKKPILLNIVCFSAKMNEFNKTNSCISVLNDKCNDWAWVRLNITLRSFKKNAPIYRILVKNTFSKRILWTLIFLASTCFRANFKWIVNAYIKTFQMSENSEATKKQKQKHKKKYAHNDTCITCFLYMCVWMSAVRAINSTQDLTNEVYVREISNIFIGQRKSVIRSRIIFERRSHLLPSVQLIKYKQRTNSIFCQVQIYSIENTINGFIRPILFIRSTLQAIG